MEYKDKRVLLIGYGESGKACEAFLKARGAVVSVQDDYSGLAADLSVKYDFGVISPGVSPRHKTVSLLKAKGVSVISEPDLAYLNCRSENIAAISGTNGKTTTCTILFDMLQRVGRAHLVGNIGTPFISAVDAIGKKDYVVMEISSFQLEQSMYFRPAVAALTNVGEDHLDRHGTKEKYQALKLSLLENASVAVRNADDPAQSVLKNAVAYSVASDRADYFLQNGKIFFQGGALDLPQVSRGATFDRDFLCAFAVACTLCGIKKEFVKSYDRTVLPHFRNEYVGTLAGASIRNDSKGTNIDATLFACSLLEDSAALILGGSDKGEDYRRLMDGIGDKVDRVYLVGANAGEMYAAASEKTRRKCLLLCDLEACVADFVKKPLPVLLFSPASASFDKYSGYQERGEHFNEIIRKYGAIFAEK